MSLAAELLPLTVPEVRRLLWALVSHQSPPPRTVLHWSTWRRHRDTGACGHSNVKDLLVSCGSGGQRRATLDRLVLTDAQWIRMAELIPGKVCDPGRSGTDNRRFVEAVLWIVRTSSPWRDLPATFGHWNSVFRRFRRWAVGGVFELMVKVVRDDPTLNTSLRTAPLFGSIRRPPAQKRD